MSEWCETASWRWDRFLSPFFLHRIWSKYWDGVAILKPGSTKKKNDWIEDGWIPEPGWLHAIAPVHCLCLLSSLHVTPTTKPNSSIELCLIIIFHICFTCLFLPLSVYSIIALQLCKQIFLWLLTCQHLSCVSQAVLQAYCKTIAQ